ncbi:DUF3025 domain-containing protein [Herminiimonas sp. CN]|uniref:DUF3025 domain-containing protein n=1 Tax=Herminiimonas sp. CN TaxID=1349818 RepID=UPI000551053A
MPSFYSAIDWSRPWYASIHAAAQNIIHAPNWRAALNAQAVVLALRNHRGLPLSFVPQGDLPDGAAYEAFISASACVPTRENLHDFFNALVWLSFPRIKRALNALQAAQIALDGIGHARGPARDAATIFDENAALLLVRDAPPGRARLDALRNHQWQDAFTQQRGDFGSEAEVWLFGHALMEKLVAPYKAITAHTRAVLVDDTYFALDRSARRDWIDRQVAQELTDQGLSAACFTPLPVLGVPDWWPGQDQAFYDDTSVFRPPRVARSPAGSGCR